MSIHLLQNRILKYFDGYTHEMCLIQDIHWNSVREIYELSCLVSSGDIRHFSLRPGVFEDLMTQGQTRPNFANETMTLVDR